MRPAGQDWDPGAYAGFRGLRLRPAIDLLAQVPALPGGDVIDLGCGNGAVAPALRTKAGPARLIGVDTSPAMLAEARATGAYDALITADAVRWSPEAPPSLIFSNALCHWLPDHDELFHRLAEALAPGGTLAVQMPRQFGAPSHRLLREVAQRLFPDRFDYGRWQAPVWTPAEYLRLLTPLGDASVWETEYLQTLPPTDDGHPVRHFTRSTAMRPILERLGPSEQTRFLDAYDLALARAYPLAGDGSAVMPFRRVFFVLTRPRV